MSGPQASAGLVDLFYMMARTTWIERPADLEPLLPRQASIIHPLRALDSRGIMSKIIKSFFGFCWREPGLF